MEHGCKLCDRRFPSGKSLGGHMRSHVMSYGLRKNPKKTTKIAEEEDGEIEMELKEVALCLMMMSADSTASATAEFSDKNSAVAEDVGVDDDDEDEKEREDQYLRKRKSRKRSDYSSGLEELGKIKKSRFQCSGCKKSFGSYQALGGHRAANKRTKGGCSSSIKKETETETESDPTPFVSVLESDGVQQPPPSVGSNKYKNKKASHFECSLCFKVFGSGQALGGHKRAHLTVNSGNGYVDAPEQRASTISPDGLLFDLNVPAGFTDGNSGVSNEERVGSSLVSWSTGRKRGHSLIVSGL